MTEQPEVPPAEPLRDELSDEGVATELASFHRSLAAFCRAELPLGRALKLLGAELEKGRLRRACAALEADVEKGVPLAEAYRRCDPPGQPGSGLFPPAYAAIVEAGIASGDLAASFDEIARDAEIQAGIAARLRRTLGPPLVSGFLILLVGLALAIFAWPMTAKLVHVVDNGGGASNLFYGAGFQVVFGVVAGGMAILFLLLAIFWLRDPLGNRLFARWPFRALPVFGSLRRQGAVASAFATLAILVRREIPLHRALELASGASGDEQLARRFAAAGSRVSNGEALSEALGDEKVLERSLHWLLASTEKTGGLGGVLSSISEIYRNRLRRTTERLGAVLGPVAEVATGCIVFGFVYVFVSPLIGMLDTIAAFRMF